MEGGGSPDRQMGLKSGEDSAPGVILEEPFMPWASIFAKGGIPVFCLPWPYAKRGTSQRAEGEKRDPSLANGQSSFFFSLGAPGAICGDFEKFDQFYKRFCFSK